MYQPKLNLKFDPPLTEGYDWDSTIQTLAKAYPNLKWHSGTPILNFYPFRETDVIYFLTIGYWDDEPDMLTYTESEDQDVGYRYIDGHEWHLKEQTDFDQTSSFFDSLNESDELEWAHDAVSNIVYHPDGVIPNIGDRVKISYSDSGWLGDYQRYYRGKNSFEAVVDDLRKGSSYSLLHILGNETGGRRIQVPFTSCFKSRWDCMSKWNIIIVPA